jgi:hypothetical protein
MPCLACIISLDHITSAIRGLNSGARLRRGVRERLKASAALAPIGGDGESPVAGLDDRESKEGRIRLPTRPTGLASEVTIPFVDQEPLLEFSFASDTSFHASPHHSHGVQRLN